MQTEKTAAESKRLERLFSYDILDTAQEASFDRITKLTQAALQVPIAMISLVGANREWVKSIQGAAIKELPRETSFGAHTIEANEPTIVGDALEDARFRQNPLVIGEPHVRFYAGVPLTAAGGFRLGALCAMDREPRRTSDTQIDILQNLARLAVDQIEFRKLALSDSLTGLCTRRAFVAELTRQAAAAKRTGRSLACLVFDIDHFRTLNDNYGGAAGDLILQAIAEICRNELRKIDVASRIGNKEFGVLMPETGVEGAMRAAERLRQAIAGLVIDYAGQRIRITASFGISLRGAAEDDAMGVIERSEQALQEAKRNGRNRAAILAPPGDQLESPPRARLAVRR